METNRVCFWNTVSEPEVFAVSRQEEQAAQPATRRSGTRDSLILVPIESTEVGAEVIELAIGIAQKANGQLLLVHAIALNLAEYGPANPTRLMAEERREMERELGECVDFSEKAGVPASYLITEGSVPTVIGRVAREQQPSLIVLSSKRGGRLAKLVGRHTVQKVVQTADCPVLVIQPGK